MNRVDCRTLLLISAALVSLPIVSAVAADLPKPLPTQAAEAIQPFAKQFTDTTARVVNEFLAGTTGVVGDAARRNQPNATAAQTGATGNTRKTMTQCLKPGDLIDQDVKECMEGKRTKDW